MKYIFSLIFALIFVRLQAQYNNFSDNADGIVGTKASRIVIQLENLPDRYYRKTSQPGIVGSIVAEDTMEIRMQPLVHPMLKNSKKDKYKERVVNGKVKWVIYSDQALTFFFDALSNIVIVNPGDSIHVNFKDDKPVFSGIGADNFKMLSDIMEVSNRYKERMMPGKVFPSRTKTIEEYWKWYNYESGIRDTLLKIIDKYKQKLSPIVYDHQSENYKGAELNSIMAFSALVHSASKDTASFAMMLDSLVAIYDSTLLKSLQWIKSNQDKPLNQTLLYYSVHLELYRQHNFSLPDSLKLNRHKREAHVYNMVKQNYKGLVRERLLAYIIAEDVISWDYSDPLRGILLDDYYNQPGFPEYKEWVSTYENYRNGRGGMVDGRVAPDFKLKDVHGNVVTKTRLKGKVILINFWKTGNSDCISRTALLNKVYKSFVNDTNVVFLNISADTSNTTWAGSIAEGKYTPQTGVHLRIGTEVTDYPMKKAYNIVAFPKLHLLDSYGRNVKLELNDDNFIASLTEHIVDQQTQMHDGPYLLDHQKDTYTYSIYNAQLSSKKVTRRNNFTVEVHTDRKNEHFTVRLKSNLLNEPSVFAQPPKLLCISDIEGNFRAFRKLLQAGGVMDEHYNWTFGNGHLVLNGDFFDRGTQVTECLWLIYSLEEKARSAGGYVHYILGNHEIMNLSNNLSYVHDKYKHSAALMGVEYGTLYNADTELGRWLRTKNIMERIGNVLFVHGGISPSVNKLSMDIAEINSLARGYYSGSTHSSDSSVLTLFDSKASPFWFRGYYISDTSALRNELCKQQLDSTLRKFSVNQVITGHTIVEDTISLWYDRKVINVDTKHSEGKSEALLIVDNEYYRIAGDGKKTFLFALPANTNLVSRQRKESID